MRVTPYIVDYDKANAYGTMVRYMRSFDSKDDLFRFVSRMYAFADYGFTVYSIECYDVKCRYTGKQDGMKFTYISTKSGNVIWEGDFPEWRGRERKR